MRSTTIIAVTLLIGLVTAIPLEVKTGAEITEKFLLDVKSIYTSEHDIIEIVVPVNALNFDDTDFSLFKNGTVVFFVEADKDDKGQTVSKGLYVLKDNVATKLLENGRGAAAANDRTNIVYLAATDGLYIYNATTNKAEKYGTITDNIVGIAKENGTDALYILTADHKVYKVTDNGNKKVKLNIENAIQIVLDYQNHIYFLTVNNEPYVYVEGRPKKISHIPQTLTYAKFLRPPLVLDSGVVLMANDKSYIVYMNGHCEDISINFLAKPSAYSVETTLSNIYAYKKKIYKYNIPMELQEEQHYDPNRLQYFATMIRPNRGKVSV